jgi:uncharacterized coiled-coil protein SlyX
MERDWRDDRIEELERLVAEQAKRIAEFELLVAKLTEQLNANSRNSSKAPSKEIQQLVDHVRYPNLEADIDTRAA